MDHGKGSKNNDKINNFTNTKKHRDDVSLNLLNKNQLKLRIIRKRRATRAN